MLLFAFGPAKAQEFNKIHVSWLDDLASVDIEFDEIINVRSYFTDSLILVGEAETSKTEICAKTGNSWECLFTFYLDVFYCKESGQSLLPASHIDSLPASCEQEDEDYLLGFGLRGSELTMTLNFDDTSTKGFVTFDFEDPLLKDFSTSAIVKVE